MPLVSPVGVRIAALSIHRADLQSRLPFRYGIVTMTHVPHIFLRAEVETALGETFGIAADHLSPKWFTKDPARSLEDEIEEMLAVVRSACRLAHGREAKSAFAFWREVAAAQTEEAAKHNWPPLLAGFGVSLVERAVIEAVARVAGRPFARCLRDGTLGFAPGEIHAELAGLSASEALPPPIEDAVVARHTVGLADPLTEDEIAPDARVGDGLPESLEAAIRVYGLIHYKIKIAGSSEADLERLRRVVSVIGRNAPRDWAFSLDGNEGFRDVASFRSFCRALDEADWWRAVRARLLFIEQPWHRDVALSDGIGALLRAWPERPPLIIDESDAESSSLPRALALGYDGTSHKNCKGVFKGAASACLLARQSPAARPRILSGEDLANIGPVALLQDLAAQAAFGVSSVERNGHHYFRGLSFWPESVQREMLARHGDLYRKSEYGWPTLAVEGGKISVRSIVSAPFGRAGEFDLSGFERVSDWK
ncbi:MAG: hypothetical protein ACREIA_05335 [Opitutaceae bacterium]